MITIDGDSMEPLLSSGDRILIDTSQRVPSPCISVCRMDPVSGRCQGCFRSIDEIVTWASLGESEKRAVWRAVVRRADLEQN